MNTITLSPRLAAVAKSVPAGARLIDVGTDHAMLPVYLAQTGRIAHAFASDIRPGPLTAARALVAKTGTGETGCAALHARTATRSRSRAWAARR